MASRKERFVGVFEFSVRPARYTTSPAALKLENFRKIRDYLVTSRDNDKQVLRPIEAGRLDIILDDLKVYEPQKCVALLFTVIDADAVDSVFRHRRTYEENIHRKGPDEGGAASAHLVIDLEQKQNVFRYVAGLENVEGVSRSRIVPFLQEIMREVLGVVSSPVDGVQVSGEPKVELDSLHKDKVKDAAGRPLSVDLVDLSRRRIPDDRDIERYRESKRTVSFTIGRKSPPGEALRYLMEIRDRQKTEFPEYQLMRIRWERPDGKTVTLPIDSVADDLLQQAFTRLELISGFDPELQGATKEIRDDVVMKMRTAVRKHLQSGL